ncbi:hypothetical protein LTR97_005313 [Elasticomyces elasticus]|uniref:MYND-type domain-containing protein n=1 Tax=Elasticomyces elasticus TaxID=574655 RepID=A0AAN8A1Z5_9PEZI|nr:hypothetical protein LTR97_005313 [Elasticomyces elasticus]
MAAATPSLVPFPTQCGECGKAASMKFGACKIVKYCDTKCQRKDWSVHKTICSPELLTVDVRPNADHRRAILLPETGERPVLVWFDGSKPDFAQFLTTSYTIREVVAAGIGDGEHLDHDITVAYRDNMLIDKMSKKNKLLERLTGGKIKEFWRGPLLLYGTPPPELATKTDYYRYDSSDEDDNECVDVHPCDLGIAVKALKGVAQKQQASVARHKERFGEDSMNKE